jgi:hypothetical protein
LEFTPPVELEPQKIMELKPSTYFYETIWNYHKLSNYFCLNTFNHGRWMDINIYTWNFRHGIILDPGLRAWNFRPQIQFPTLMKILDPSIFGGFVILMVLPIWWQY